MFGRWLQLMCDDDIMGFIKWAIQTHPFWCIVVLGFEVVAFLLFGTLVAGLFKC